MNDTGITWSDTGNQPHHLSFWGLIDDHNYNILHSPLLVVRGTGISMCHIYLASSQADPPLFIFPSSRRKPRYIIGISDASRDFIQFDYIRIIFPKPKPEQYQFHSRIKQGVGCITSDPSCSEALILSLLPFLLLHTLVPPLQCVASIDRVCLAVRRWTPFLGTGFMKANKWIKERRSVLNSCCNGIRSILLFDMLVIR